MPSYILSPQAQASLGQIRDYTLEQFGKNQTTHYLSMIRDRLRVLANKPSIGKHRDDIKAGYYSAFVGSHTIYYTITDTHIDILDILHQRMEPGLYLL